MFVFVRAKLITSTKCSKKLFATEVPDPQDEEQGPHVVQPPQIAQGFTKQGSFSVSRSPVQDCKRSLDLVPNPQVALQEAQFDQFDQVPVT